LFWLREWHLSVFCQDTFVRSSVIRLRSRGLVAKMLLFSWVLAVAVALIPVVECKLNGYHCQSCEAGSEGCQDTLRLLLQYSTPEESHEDQLGGHD
jgi:hypothetical protein